MCRPARVIRRRKMIVPIARAVKATRLCASNSPRPAGAALPAPAFAPIPALNKTTGPFPVAAWKLPLGALISNPISFLTMIVQEMCFDNSIRLTLHADSIKPRRPARLTWNSSAARRQFRIRPHLKTRLLSRKCGRKWQSVRSLRRSQRNYIRAFP